MPGDTQPYNLATIRSLLRAAFTVQTLRRFCQDRPVLRPLLDEFSPDHGLNEMADRIITYCETHLLFDQLLAGVEEVNPKQYTRFEPDLLLPPYIPPDVPCPYRGLQPFEAEHADFYFGREVMVQRLVTRVVAQPFVAVVGASGCGKSSLVRAGLATALRGEALPDSESWAVHIFRPGADPLRALSAPLIELLEPDAAEVVRMAEIRKLAEHLRDGTLTLPDVVARLGDKHPDLPRLVLIADQFEELYTECRDGVLQQAFVEALLVAAEAGIGVVLTLRADFYGHVLADRRLGQAVDAGLTNVLPMSDEELRAAIEQPALKTGRTFESGLVERILEDVAGEPGNLPLLEFALTELWARQTGRGVLSHEAYEASGRVAGAIARRAETVYGGLVEEGRGETVRRVFLRLIRQGEGTEGTRRQVTLDDLVTARTPQEEVQPVIQALVDARLLVTGRNEATGAATAEVSHEALGRGWERLRHWLEEDRAFGRWQERMAAVRQTWQEMGQDEGALLHGAPLAEAEGWLAERGDDLNEAEQTFIREGLALREREAAAREEQQRRDLETARRLAQEAEARRQAEEQRAREAEARRQAQEKSAVRLRWLVVILTLAALVAPGWWTYRQILRAMARGPLIHVPASQAIIGSDDELASDDEGPAWMADIPSFSIERYEVTNRQYRLCVMANVCTPPQDESLYQQDERRDHPVVTVNAYQASEYCHWLGWRLPTELEWERAARGPDGRSWPWGEELPDPTRLNILFDQGAIGDTTPVGHYPQGATAEGVFDMAGNVWEWTASAYQPYPYDPDAPGTVWDGGPATAPEQLVLRGGGWQSSIARPTARSAAIPIFQDKDLGFRCARGSD